MQAGKTGGELLTWWKQVRSGSFEDGGELRLTQWATRQRGDGMLRRSGEVK